jgi:hypothetical protein
LLFGTRICAALALMGSLSVPSRAQGPSPGAYRLRPWLSSSGEALFRERHAQGHYRNHPLARWYGEPSEPSLLRGAVTSAPSFTQDESAPDALVNDRNPPTCTGCSGLGISQVEATVAVDGLNILVGWNDLERRCFTTSGQNYGWSTDGGITFTDGGHYPPSDVGGGLYGDPTHAVHSGTHAFYMAGLHQASIPGNVFSGIGAAKGHFGPGGFTLDLNKLAVPNPNRLEDFFDKPWMTVDPMSGNVYFAWANFSPITSYIEFARCDSNLNLLGPIQRMSEDSCATQFGVPAVGPDGELYVIWRQNCVASLGVTGLGLGEIVVRKSTDFGATFGPKVVVSQHTTNNFTGGPGFLRFFASTQPGIVVDRTGGPHRGRVYVAWDQCVNYLASRSDHTSGVDTEPNDTLAQAQSFVPGGKLRGMRAGVDSDWYRFDGITGQTFYIESVISFETPSGYDSTRGGVAMRLYCPGAQGDPELALNDNLTSGGTLHTLKETGTYYLEVYGITATETSPYVAWTNLVTPEPGDPARDQRDQVLAWSDDGVTWSAPVRIVDGAIGYDGQYPWPAVDGKGRVHCSWMDFRLDSHCILPRSTQVITSSGDGGVTWGPNRTIADAPSFWDPNICHSNGNNQGDYQHTVADGDLVVAAFTDQRLGDPDIFVDAELYRAVASCPAGVSAGAGRDTTLLLGLENQGNSRRTFAWRLEDSRGWLVGALPALSGERSLGAGESLDLTATIRLQDCAGDSTTVSLIHSDPAIPGFEERCTTVVRCADVPTSVVVSLVQSHASPGLVRITWFSREPAVRRATVWRRGELDSWMNVGNAAATGDGYLVYEDREELAEGPYAYRLEIETYDGEIFTSGEAWVEVQRPRFALGGVLPNPTAGPMMVTVALETGDAKLELLDVGGRLVARREMHGVGPGRHSVLFAEGATLPQGIYSLRLTEKGRSAFARVVIAR